MTVQAWILSAFYVTALLLLAFPLGLFMAKVYRGEKTFLHVILAPVENAFYRLAGVDVNEEMSWKRYGFAVLLDLGLPDGDGLTLVSELREWSRVPIIVISARGREDDKVRALDAGADDYLTKPFGTNELFARMRVALRRTVTGAAGSEDPVLRFDALTIDRAKRTVLRETTELHLTPIEYKLLVFLAEHAGKVLTHRQILKEVWGSQHATQTHYVRVHMAELRKKVEANPSMPRLIVTESGVGYRLKG